MMKIDAKVEMVFAQAVTLEQSGRFRSTVYGIGSEVLIMNQDNSLMIRFALPDSVFANPVSFRANDYESREFQEQDGRIVFRSAGDEFVRIKSCSAPGKTAADIRAMWKVLRGTFPQDSATTIPMSKGVLEYLDDDLSHVELSVEGGEWKLVQRNIYSGAVIEVKVRKRGLMVQGAAMEDRSPIGLRTNDFKALFSFVDSIDFHVPEDPGCVYLRSSDARWKMEGMLACCRYDQLGFVHIMNNAGEESPSTQEEAEHGRQEQKVRRRK